MFGFKYFRFQPTEYVMHYRRGRLARAGAGLNFWAFLPVTALEVVPLGTMEAPFFVEESTRDYQAVAIQGQAVFQIADPRAIARRINYSVDVRTQRRLSEDPVRVGQRVVNLVLVEIKRYLEKLDLDEALASSEAMADAVMESFHAHPEMEAMGLEILGLSILSNKPTKETIRALEARKREDVLKQADEAIYERRNASIGQERSVKENELNTEIAVEFKKREIRETQIEAERILQMKEHELRRAAMDNAIALEEKRSQLVELSAENIRTEAEARAYGLAAMVRALEGTSPQTIQVLAGISMQPSQLIARAFEALAENSGKIGQLNISPDLLQQLIKEEN